MPSLLIANDLMRRPLFAQLTDARAARLVVIQTGLAKVRERGLVIGDPLGMRIADLQTLSKRGLLA